MNCFSLRKVKGWAQIFFFFVFFFGGFCVQVFFFLLLLVFGRLGGGYKFLFFLGGLRGGNKLFSFLNFGGWVGTFFFCFFEGLGVNISPSFIFLKA